MSSPGDQSAVFDLEFRSCVDDGWYSAQALLEGNTLIVKLEGFPESIHDEVFNSGDFATPEAVDKFRQRFRPLCRPLEDSQCWIVVEGTIVCATFKGDGQVRFFDAVVEAVNYAEHSSDKCTCTFLLCWLHGPEEGNVTSNIIADICLFTSGTLNSRVVDYFTNLAKEKIKVASQHSNSVTDEISLSKGLACDSLNFCSPTKSKSSSSGHKFQENESARQFTDWGSITEGRERKYCQQSDQDGDLGGIKETGNHHYIIIENLEKNLSPSSVIEFIHKQTSITPQAYIFPSLSSESYTRGAIVLDCRMKLKKIYEFLNNPNHFIVALTGRPWVIVENMLRCGTFKTTLGSLLPTSQYDLQNKDRDSELKVVHSGTDEYMRAKRLRGLFDEFHNHLNGLRKRLAMEEKRLFHQSNAI